ncbi:MAG: four helix bundle protein [Chitinophagaceae bacterium]|nr:MAG: four helix bundle protein [Chitinophagaceae bacterium]
MKQNVLKQKSFLFAVRIVNLYKFLKREHKEFILSNQLIRSGTSIGAIVREAEHAESLKDFVHKLSIGLKETNEATYWLEILRATDYISEQMYISMNEDCEELLRLLTASVKTSKSRIK